MKAVQFDSYGGPEVLEVRDVPEPDLGPGRVLVAVRATSINPGEIAIREGRMHGRFPSTFPSGQGSDLAGVVRDVGEGVSAFAPGNEVLGWTDERNAHAELVAAREDQLVAKPAGLSWEVAGSLHVAGLAALASVRAVDPQPGEVVAVSAAAGGVGGIAAQLARRAGARVLGLAGSGNHDWLRARDIVPVEYGPGQEERLRKAAGGPLDAFIDTFGGGYVELALELGVPRERVNTIIDFEAAQRLGVTTKGTQSAASAENLAELARLAAGGELEVPIARTFPLAEVRTAFAELARRHGRGKTVLIP